MLTNGEIPAAARVLVLSGDLGDGHRQAARALAETCGEGLAERVRAEVIDFMQEVYPYLHPMVKYCFMKGVEKAPSVYGYLYRKTRRKEAMPIPFKTFLSLGLSRFLTLLEEKRPDIIVCTFPLAAAAVSLLKEKGAVSTPLVTVITDHTDHSLWLQPHTDLYLVGSEQVAAALRLHGVSSSRIRVTGIPVRRRFSESFDRVRLCQSFGLDPQRPVVLVMGGGSGMLDESVRSLIRSTSLLERLQLVVICGSNAAVREELEAELQEHPTNRVIVKGFVEEIHEWMAVADLLVTKPGGLTTAEAVAMGLPMLLYKPIPGQEEDNAAVLEKAGVAIRATAARALQDQLLELADNRLALAAMQGRARQFRRQRPTEQAWDAIMHLQQTASSVRKAWQTTTTIREAW